MEQIKFFNLQKNKKQNDAQPDYRISFKKKDAFVQGGACWIKKDKVGNTFLSCKLGDVYKDHTNESNSSNGWHIEEDTPQQSTNPPERIIKEQENEDMGF